MTASPLGEVRFGLELAGLLRAPVFVRPGRARDPAPVLLVPGFLAGDGSLQLLGTWLRRRGHRVCTAAMWANVDCSGEAAERLEERLERFAARAGAPVTLVGQSRGGTLCRALAARRPDLVSRIVMLGSPVLDQMAVNPFVRVALGITAVLGSLGVPGLLTTTCRSGDCCAAVYDELARELGAGVRAVAVYSRTDGIVDWRSCLDPAAEHMEVRSSHCGMSVNAAVYEVVRRVLDEPASAGAALRDAA